MLQKIKAVADTLPKTISDYLTRDNRPVYKPTEQDKVILAQLDKIGFYDFGNISEVAQIINQQPSVLNIPSVQEMIKGLIQLCKHWKYHYSIYNLTATLQPSLKTENFVDSNQATKKFIASLQRTYAYSTRKVLASMTKYFISESTIVDRYRTHFNPRIKELFKKIRKMKKDLDRSELPQTAKEDLQKVFRRTKKIWNKTGLRILFDIRLQRERILREKRKK